MEDYLFVSDIHGRSPELEASLLEIVQNKNPKIVFFVGDVVGTDLLNKLQKLFYNGVYNHIKKLLQINPNPTDEEILYFFTENGKTLANGAIDLWNFLDNLYYSETDPPLYMVDYIRELAQHAHFGNFVSNLPKEIRDILRKDMEINAKAIIDLMTKFTDQGSLVVIIEGNWDTCTPLDFYPTTEHKIIPIQKRQFFFKSFLKSRNSKVLYLDTVSTIETENEIFVIWPFNDAVIPIQIPKFKHDETRKIILVSHGHINWHAVKGDTPMTNENQNVQINMGTTVHDLKPNTVVHGHLHVPGNDYSFENIPVKYLPLHTFRFIEF